MAAAKSADVKTKKHEGSVLDFLNAVENEQRRTDSLRLLEIMTDVTGEPPAMWGPSIVGFGTYHYVYESGREGDWMLTGFSPRKQSLTLYIMSGFGRFDELLGKLGTFKTGKSCLYVNRLEDVDEAVLREMIADSIAYLKERYA